MKGWPTVGAPHTSQSVVGKTTTALRQDREGRRDALHTRLQALANSAVKALQVGPAEIRTCLERLHDLLKKEDAARANSVFRQILEPITMTPVEESGRRFYRATGAAKEPEMLNRLGVDPGGRFRWLRGPAITEINAPHLRGRRRLNRRANLILSQSPSTDGNAWEFAGNRCGNTVGIWELNRVSLRSMPPETIAPSLSPSP